MPLLPGHLLDGGVCCAGGIIVEDIHRAVVFKTPLEPIFNLVSIRQVHSPKNGFTAGFCDHVGSLLAPFFLQIAANYFSAFLGEQDCSRTTLSTSRACDEGNLACKSFFHCAPPNDSFKMI